MTIATFGIFVLSHFEQMAKSITSVEWIKYRFAMKVLEISRLQTYTTKINSQEFPNTMINEIDCYKDVTKPQFHCHMFPDVSLHFDLLENTEPPFAVDTTYSEKSFKIAASSVIFDTGVVDFLLSLTPYQYFALSISSRDQFFFQITFI